jgi:TIR domain-containing protein
MAHDVFISYASPDRHVANAVCARLEQAAVRCWIAPRDVGAGNYPTALVRAITSSKLLVVVVSQGANGSPNVSREVHHAVKKGKLIVPFRIEDVLPSGDLEYLLDITHWLDAITPPLDRHLQMLVAKIRGLVADPEHAPAPAAKHTPPQAQPAAQLIPVVLTLPDGYASIGDPVCRHFQQLAQCRGGPPERRHADPGAIPTRAGRWKGPTATPSIDRPAAGRIRVQVRHRAIPLAALDRGVGARQRRRRRRGTQLPDRRRLSRACRLAGPSSTGCRTRPPGSAPCAPGRARRSASARG